MSTEGERDGGSTVATTAKYASRLARALDRRQTQGETEVRWIRRGVAGVALVSILTLAAGLVGMQASYQSINAQAELIHLAGRRLHALQQTLMAARLAVLQQRGESVPFSLNQTLGRLEYYAEAFGDIHDRIVLRETGTDTVTQDVEKEGDWRTVFFSTDALQERSIGAREDHLSVSELGKLVATQLHTTSAAMSRSEVPRERDLLVLFRNADTLDEGLRESHFSRIERIATLAFTGPRYFFVGAGLIFLACTVIATTIQFASVRSLVLRTQTMVRVCLLVPSSLAQVMHEHTLLVMRSTHPSIDRDTDGLDFIKRRAGADGKRAGDDDQEGVRKALKLADDQEIGRLLQTAQISSSSSRAGPNAPRSSPTTGLRPRRIPGTDDGRPNPNGPTPAPDGARAPRLGELHTNGLVSASKRGLQASLFSSARKKRGDHAFHASWFMWQSLMRLMVLNGLLLFWIVLVGLLLNNAAQSALQVYQNMFVAQFAAQRVNDMVLFATDDARPVVDFDFVPASRRNLTDDVLETTSDLLVGGSVHIPTLSNMELAPLSRTSSAFPIFLRDACAWTETPSDCRSVDTGILAKGVLRSIIRTVSLVREQVEHNDTVFNDEDGEASPRDGNADLLSRMWRLNEPYIQDLLLQASFLLRDDGVRITRSSLNAVVGITVACMVLFIAFTAFAALPSARALSTPFYSATRLLGLLPDTIIIRVPELRIEVQNFISESNLERITNAQRGAKALAAATKVAGVFARSASQRHPSSQPPDAEV